MARIYPRGTRTNSSNYDPIPYWFGGKPIWTISKAAVLTHVNVTLQVASSVSKAVNRATKLVLTVLDLLLNSCSELSNDGQTAAH